MAVESAVCCQIENIAAIAFIHAPFQRLLINLVALVEIDGTPGVAFEAEVIDVYKE